MSLKFNSANFESGSSKISSVKLKCLGSLATKMISANISYLNQIIMATLTSFGCGVGDFGRWASRGGLA